jgi:hypothetical protein
VFATILLIHVPYYLVKAFVEVTRFLLTIPGVTGQYILSETFTQDSLENYLGQLRSRRGWCENPTVKNLHSH